MQTKIIEAMQPGGTGNWGKFMVMKPDGNEWLRQSKVSDLKWPLLMERGWSPEHIIVLDIETCEAAVFSPHGSAHHDMRKRRIWVCPLFEPFLEWLYKQDLDDISTLPDLVEIEAPASMAGYRRPGSEDPPMYVSDDPLDQVLAELRDYADAGQAASRAATGRAVVEIEALWGKLNSTVTLTTDEALKRVSEYWVAYHEEKGREVDSGRMMITLSDARKVINDLADMGIALTLASE